MRKIIICLIVTLFTLQAWEKDVCEANKLQIFPRIVKSEIDGGVIIYWIDNRNNHYEIYAKKIRGEDGETYGNWPPQGKEVSLPYTTPPHGHRLSPIGVTDESGSIILAWINHHNFTNYPPGIYATRLNANNGSLLWNEEGKSKGGIKIYTSHKHPIFPPSICSDGDGGCVVVVREKRYNAGLKKNEYRIRAWRILSDGTFADDPYYPGWNGKTGIDVVSWTTEVLGNPKAIQKFDFLGNKYKILSGRRMI